MNIPDEAVEAAAKAIAARTLGLGKWEDMSGSTRRAFLDDAHAALEAAAPYLIAQALREAADEARDPSVKDMDAYHIDQADVWLWLRNRAVDVEAAK